MQKRHIYLSGFMGAGKSKIGRELARLARYPFIDTDKIIESESGRSIKEIFAAEGEAAFRRMERDVLQRMTRIGRPAVISLGGGALMHEDNRRAVQMSGWLVYIESAPRAILQRVKHTEKRPLLNDLPAGADAEDALLQRINELLEIRRPVYEQADILFKRDAYEWQEAAQIIFGKLKEKGFV